MSIIKQISVFNGNSWDTDNIGANAGNIELLSSDGSTASTVAGSTNLLTGLTNILPTNALTASRALISDGNGKISTSSVTSTQLGRLSGVTSNVQTQINNINTLIGNTSITGIGGGTLTGAVSVLYNNFKRIIKSYNNLTLTGMNPFLQLDTYEGLGLSKGKYIVSMEIRGWTGNGCGCLNIVKGTTGMSLYVMASKEGFIEVVTVEYFVADIVGSFT